MNLASIIYGHDADAVALIDGDHPDDPEARLSYGRLRDRVAAAAAGLADHGVGPDDRVALLAGTEIDFAVGALASLQLGAAVAPISIGSPLPELQRKLAAVDPKVVAVGGEGRWAIGHRAELAVELIDLTDLPEPAVDADRSNGHAEGALTPTTVARRDESHLAFLMLTSGVSSDAKVAKLTHGNLAWVQEAAFADPGLAFTAEDVALCALPLAHIFGLNSILLSALRVGATVVLHRRFDAGATLASIQRFGATLVGAAPPMWRRWAECELPEERTPTEVMASVRIAASGAAPLPFEVFEVFRDRYGIEIRQGYGLTETSPNVTSTGDGPIKPGSVGRPLPGVDLVLVEPDGSPVDVGDTGEIVIRGPGVFDGYLDAPELTSAVLTDDGWFWTGDVGAFDDDGYLYIVDRMKDVIIVSGFNVYPSEVEAALAEHPDVVGAVVVGRPDELSGEAVVAHITGRADPDALDRYMRGQLSRYKCPVEYHRVDELPVAPTGKLIRRELRR